MSYIIKKCLKHVFAQKLRLILWGDITTILNHLSVLDSQHIHSSDICGFYTFLTMLSMDMESPQTSPAQSSFGTSDGGGGLERSAVPGRLSGSFKGTEAWVFFDLVTKAENSPTACFSALYVNAGTRIEKKMFVFTFLRISCVYQKQMRACSM
jgi:hypothetical protein